ncbi:cell wall hydrolase [Brevundimonas aurifodinae]|uniref:Cell wall hydrolase n=2 Tax=Brevundimonas TaxID=41275 RepID=A0ABV1NJD6_9CAUL|nr:MAG: cell wall hydrolase [Brevundimonas sp. 12-68-7]OYX34753.1 MAG: cell wall hydrolase [Brevundimonas subvibrioides]
MTAGTETLPQEAWTHRLERARALALRVASSPWAPVGVALTACFAIVVVAGSALITTRLAEMRGIASDPLLTAGSTAAGALQSTEFTLAPDAVRPISMDEARVWNASLPFSTLPILAARPFIMPPESLADYGRALDCLTSAVYYEAASETALGQAAVAQVVLNRMRHPAFPKTVCGVVFQGQERTTGCQFSFTCDGALGRRPSDAGWARARAVASAALNGHVTPEVGMATHYHTDWVAPFWAARLVKMRQIDTHIFYRWTGGWGLPAAFTGAHAGAEPIITKLAAVATFVEDLTVPVVEDDLSSDLSITPMVDLAPPIVVASVEDDAGGPTQIAAPPPVEVVAAPPPPPPVLASPLDAGRGVTPQRRARIAVPR